MRISNPEFETPNPKSEWEILPKSSDKKESGKTPKLLAACHAERSKLSTAIRGENKEKLPLEERRFVRSKEGLGDGDRKIWVNLGPEMKVDLNYCSSLPQSWSVASCDIENLIAALIEWWSLFEAVGFSLFSVWNWQGSCVSLYFNYGEHLGATPVLGGSNATRMWHHRKLTCVISCIVSVWPGKIFTSHTLVPVLSIIYKIVFNYLPKIIMKF